jgi:tetratricopeptide (TPR) repeat protein
MLSTSGAPSGMRVCPATGALLAFDEWGGFEPESRQSVLPFERRPATVRSLVSQSEGWTAVLTARDAGEVERALELLERHLEHYPSHVQAWLERGRLHHLRGSFDAAVVSFCQAIALGESETARAWFCLGLVHEDRGSDVDAGHAYTEAVTLESDFSDAHFNAARVYERLGDRLRALRHLHAYRRTRR